MAGTVGSAAQDLLTEREFAGDLPPGPRGTPGVGSFVPFRWSPNEFLARTARRYGDITTFTAGRSRFYLLADPGSIKDVLVTHADRFVKGRLVERARRFLGEGLITSEGAFHRGQRRMIQPTFSGQNISAYADDIAHATVRMTARWRDGGDLDVEAEMTRLSLVIVAKTLFGTDIDDEAAAIGDALAVLSAWYPLLILPGRLDRVPLPFLRRVRRAQQRIGGFIDSVIESRRRRPGTDVVSRMLSASAGGMPPKQIRDETLTLFLAGRRGRRG